MNNINQLLLRRLKDKHNKLAARFQKGIEEGYFQEKTKRKRYTVVERLKRLEKQIQSFSNRTGEKFKVSYKHWALALAMGVVVSAASAQEKKETKFKDRLNHRIENKQSGKVGSANRTEAQTLFFTQVQQLGLPYNVEVFHGDLDADGDIDFIYVSYVDIPILFTNEGAFTFTQSDLSGDVIYGVVDASALADFDGDGDLDLFLYSGIYGQGYEAAIWLNDGNGNFTKQVATVPSGIDDDLFAIDLDGDNDADLVFQDNYGGGIQVLINNSFDFLATPGAPFYGPYAGGSSNILAVADVDGDVDIDIIYQGTDVSYNNGFRVLKNDGTGSFADAGTHVISNFSESAVADFDDDGDIDLMVANSVYPNVDVTPFLNDGAGNFTPQSVVSAINGKYPDDIFGADLNGDNFDDIVLATESDSTFIFQGNGTGGFTLMDGFAGGVIAADIDGDGDIDFIHANRNISILENQGSFPFLTHTEKIVILSYSYDLDVLDVDGDGDLDIVQGGYSRVWINDGSGQNFTVSQEIVGAGNGTVQVFADLDGDGDLDMVRGIEGDYPGGGFEIWTNTGGVFSYTSNYGAGVFSVDDIKLGNVDGDGDIDIVCLINGSPAYLKTFINQGSMSFSDLGNVNVAGYDQLQNFSQGDIDGDTDLDVVVAHGSTGISTYLNDGVGNLSVGSTFVPAGSNFDIDYINMADLDGDGDLDVVASNTYDYNSDSYVFINNGAGVFTDNGQNIVSGYSYATALADLDGDGDMDLITTSYLSKNQVWVNDGAANFTLDGELGVGDEYAQPAVGDLDNDGDLDVVIGGTYVSTLVFLNNRISANPLEPDSLALVDLYNSTLGDSWTDKTNWKTGDVNTWFGVTVTTDRVTGLDLNNNNLEGVIPASFNGLNELLTVDLSGNKISEIQTDLSGLTKLTSIDLSDNNLDFADFELIGSVPGLMVGAQTTNDTPENVEIPVGDPVTLSFVVDGTGNTYQWFKNGNILTDSTRNQIVIESISRENQGLYYCEAKNSAVPSLVLTSALKSAFGTASVTGRLLIDETTPANNGEMTLLKVTASNGYDTTRVVNINSLGEFSFGNVVLADYLIVGFADTLQHQGALPTYYQTTGRTAFWAEADTLFLGNNFNLDLVSVVYTNPVGAVGVFSGFLEEELGNSGGRVEARERVRGAGVSMRRGRRTSRTSGTGDLAYYVYTDANGDFIIKGVDPGEYNVDIQYPGYPMDEESFLDITIGDGVKDKEVSIAALVEDGKITVRQLIILSTEKESSGILMYPNPTSELLKIIDKEGRNELSVEIYDMSGNKLEKIFFDKETDINVKTLPKGQYIIKLQDVRGDEILTQRILIE